MIAFFYYVVIPIVVAYWLAHLLLFRGKGKVLAGITFLTIFFFVSGFFLYFL
jgi:hypothetical protein